MPAKKSKTKNKAVKKVTSKKTIKAIKKPAKKVVKKPVKKVVSKKIPKVAKVVKKEVKKIAVKATKTKEIKNKKTKFSDKSLDPKTSAKIIAKAKNASGNKDKTTVVEIVPEKKSEAQKNLIIVKKLAESRNKITFKAGDYAVYPSHGVGKIVEIEKTSALGQDFSCYLMYFEKEKLTIKIPVTSSEKIGLRHLVSKSLMEEVFSTLRSGVKKLKGMWSRRAQEYETKINSGDIMLLAEVLRDLTRDIEDGDRSYSERIIYETAVHRLAAEYSVIYGIDFEEAKDKIISTAKDKLGIEGKINQKDEFDEFDYDKNSDEDEDEDNEEEEEEEDDFDYGDSSSGDDEDYDDDDDKPKKKKRKK
ncbi:MAG: hypothetical protein EBS06_00215 [Proteobacteria bacterium]|nr:hypothetical protein [Pseudomonadota bacterium]